MNAKELADVMEKYSTAGFMTPLASEFKEAATMLRQQADLIELLRMGQPNIDYDKELLKPTFVGRDLTDQEIVEIINEYRWRGLTGYLLTFARAVLRKAQDERK